MKIVCALVGHLPPSQSPIWNDGRFFGRCPRCQSDIIRDGGSSSWSDLPKGFKISWKERTERAIRWDRPTARHRKPGREAVERSNRRDGSGDSAWTDTSTTLDPLKTAIAHLAGFRATWGTGDRIDGHSGLTADDLDLILAQLSRRDSD